MRTPEFDRIWGSILAHQGEEFVTITGLPFTYRVDGNGLYSSRTKYRISCTDFERAHAVGPIPGPGQINASVRGPAYIWAILHDARIPTGFSQAIIPRRVRLGSS